jgi:hypothetical protein
VSGRPVGQVGQELLTATGVFRLALRVLPGLLPGGTVGEVGLAVLQVAAVDVRQLDAVLELAA